MNRFKDKKFRILVYVGIGLYLCGIPFILSTNFRNLGVVIGMIGGGVIGLAIGLKINHYPTCQPHKNNLKQKAWKDLVVRIFSLVIGAISFYYLIRHSHEIHILNTLPGRVFMLTAVIIIGMWMTAGQFVMKKRRLFGLDERERIIYENAKMISDAVFAGLSFTGLFGLWAWLGLKASVPIYVPILLMLGLAFIAEMIQPIIILCQCMKENCEDSEGGAV